MVFDSDEYTLTDIAAYVNHVATHLEHMGLSAKEAKRVIDGYGQFVTDEWTNGTSSEELAAEFLHMYAARVPMRKPTRSLFGLSRYVAFVIVDLVSFGFEPEDALFIVDDFDDAIIAWYPLVPSRIAARRLGVMSRRLEAGHALHEKAG
jgi:hypothetical protein